MAGVSVTIESLNNVKRAFSDFQTDIESFSDKISSSTEQIITEVRQSLKKQESVVVSLEDKVSSLINEIEQIQTSIISVNSSISSLKTQIANLEKQKPQIEARISQLEQQKRQLEAQKNNSDGDTSNIDAQIRAIESLIQACRKTLSQINEQLSSARRQQAENERKSSELKACKVKTESELSTTKSELSKSQSKLERLSVAGDSVEREINNLNIATRKFEQNTSNSNETSKSGLSKCIASIDEYLAVNLGTAGNGTSHRSGRVETDAEELSDLNTEAFCRGISVNRDPMNGERYFVSGNHASDYLSYWQNMEQYTETPCEVSDDLVFVRARDIEGIHLSNSDVADPDGFWGRRTGGTQDTFESISNQISEIRTLFENGESLQEIRDTRPDLSDCIGIYYEGAPSVSSLDDFYVFNSNGRHRILAAYAADELIPVRITSTIQRRC